MLRPRRSSSTASMASEAYAVPDTETIRTRALAASWRRDRAVGRRRLALRWLGWALWRYAMPALVAVAAALLAYHQIAHGRAVSTEPVASTHQKETP